MAEPYETIENFRSSASGLPDVGFNYCPREFRIVVDELDRLTAELAAKGAEIERLKQELDIANLAVDLTDPAFMVMKAEIERLKQSSESDMAIVDDVHRQMADLKVRIAVLEAAEKRRGTDGRVQDNRVRPWSDEGWPQ
jgi:chromosome segregation ATPase